MGQGYGTPRQPPLLGLSSQRTVTTRAGRCLGSSANLLQIATATPARLDQAPTTTRPLSANERPPARLDHDADQNQALNQTRYHQPDSTTAPTSTKPSTRTSDLQPDRGGSK